ncbi:MAG TPA: hypothetical protein VMR34_04775 [Candidatus Saccharimonadales bacterium]|nr:hypothetical protein [Candidatus Saccharimonadales bacterium]
MDIDNLREQVPSAERELGDNHGFVAEVFRLQALREQLAPRFQLLVEFLSGTYDRLRPLTETPPLKIVLEEVP